MRAFTAFSPAGARTAKQQLGSFRPVQGSSSRRTVVVQARQAEAGVGIFGTKAGMMTYFTEAGLAVPATVISLESGNYVTAVKTPETDGYAAVQGETDAAARLASAGPHAALGRRAAAAAAASTQALGASRCRALPTAAAHGIDHHAPTRMHAQVGYKVVAERKVRKPELGHLAKAGCKPLKHLREFKLKDASKVAEYTPGQELDVNAIIKVSDHIDIAGTTIGKGFQGTIKRWGHRRGLMTHGSKSHREHGSTGPGSTPGRTFPGLKSAGHMGNVRRKVRALEVLLVDTERGALVVKGSVPGKRGNILEIAPAKIVGKNC
ncbi:50S ribosomal protein L3 Flags:Precursor [Monoraphidium neglectum]|uniref:Large ribosomal subunit protein uL3c n=1 Tax=Monoraphidium neglectum TaxID=145388 RepID=A0A0D2N674_9CHLO|nr:50S ribosomal protein L3 Flags:Precursor [Monoraphidium neglectum]KIZ01441.1 50S ribosomal protein L3 Flags:Precursor [Monoraphidium neglectum]|eukprot:XP_013900460.1 50S ribosomal protein L3 Flags:Precursor [Monoraphidium neglectum]